jgi:hypothetical protein
MICCDVDVFGTMKQPLAAISVTNTTGTRTIPG